MIHGCLPPRWPKKHAISVLATVPLSHSHPPTILRDTDTMLRVALSTQGRNVRWARRCFSNPSADAADDVAAMNIQNIRNIGIVAHIDAGKTTTTECLLYSSKHKTRRGEIDEGNTTTDFMEQERERGITIQSALTYIKWRDHHVNIIDTPGHVDFTMEVERGLRVLDGVVAVFDACKGVQAQSRKVLYQAEQNALPFITFVNKMDRQHADFDMSIASVEELLHKPVIPVQCPIFDDKFVGVVDLINMRCLRYVGATGEHTTSDLSEETQPVQAAAKKMRVKMLDSLSGASDEIAELYLEAMDADDEAGLAIPKDVIITHLKEASLSRSATLALCGSAGSNIAITPVMDAILDYLPSPAQRPALIATESSIPNDVISTNFSDKDPLAALVFKVQITPSGTGFERSSLIRLYSGTLRTGDRIYNSSRKCMQMVKSISIVDGADESTTVDVLHPGWVASIRGLDKSFTGDTLCASKANSFTLNAIELPVPVVSCSLETFSEKEDKVLESALAALEAEDPSLSHEINDWGQTALSGMGALHLEIAQSKLERNWGLSISTPKLHFRHHEFFTSAVTLAHKFMSNPDDASSAVCEITMTMRPKEIGKHDIVDALNEVEMSLTHNKQTEEDKRRMRNTWKQHITRGIELGFGSGILIREPVSGMHVDIEKFELLTRGNLDTVCNAADYTVKMLMEKVAKSAAMLEPVMELEIVVFDKSVVEDVTTDLWGDKRGEVVSQTETPQSTNITAIVPAKLIQTYTSDLLGITSGKSHYTSKLHGYRIVRDDGVVQEVKRERGMM